MGGIAEVSRGHQIANQTSPAVVSVTKDEPAVA
jgi:hypothetical protein